LAEEEGRAHKPGDSDVARPLPLEITFAGPEKAMRAFFSALMKLQGHYAVIRSVAVSNAKKEPPRASDAKFDKPATPVPASSPSDVFGGGFVLPGEEPKVEDKKTAPGTTPALTPPPTTPAPGTPGPGTPASTTPSTPAVVDSSRILSQVLGNEEVLVFVRLDLMQFLPAKKLP
jgi:hypothetical protein